HPAQSEGRSQVRHHSKRATLTFQKKARANLHRPALGDSRIFTPEEVRRRDTRLKFSGWRSREMRDQSNE
ncbi:hypothetical protein, partial [Deinococcus wulumuqiensis]|uniref:hypothetical protein n=1 Tax=Deinococcus wulumuqiensis TaxID=980427 RepID=UPI001CEF5963